jgi:hypothetical protein
LSNCVTDCISDRTLLRARPEYWKKIKYSLSIQNATTQPEALIGESSTSDVTSNRVEKRRGEALMISCYS